MKYNIKSISCMAFALFCFSACNSFLDEEPMSEITNENYAGGNKDKATEYKKGSEMEQLLSGAYRDYASEFWQLDWYIMNDGQSDNAYAGESKDQTLQVDELKMLSTNALAKRDWGYLYSQISKANTILEWTPRIEDTQFTDKRRTEIEGEARAIRALTYFNLVRIYGNVPLIVDYIPEISLDNIDEIYPLLYPKQTPIEEVYNQIIKDLEIAIEKAPDYSDRKFKITKALANLLMAQVYATKDESGSTDWAKVKQYASAVVADSRYGLMANYDDLFAVDALHNNGVLPSKDLKNENCKESIFEVEYSSWSTLGNWGSQMFFGFDWKKFNTPSHDLYRAFSSANDNIRLEASITFQDITGKWTDNYWSSVKYPFSHKQRSQEAGNVILYRLPEAILLLAEAENELGNINEAKKLLNQIRTRVQLPNTTANTKDALRLAIENEYRLEFAFEGKRWMDLKRRNRFIEVMNSTKDHQKLFAKNLSVDRLLWPIPQSELDLNDKLVQNSGY